MLVKYRVYEVGKDFKVTSKAVMEILKRYGVEPKNHMTTLDEGELDIIFEHFTQNNQTEDLDAYLIAGQKELEVKKAEEEAQRKAEEEAAKARRAAALAEAGAEKKKATKQPAKDKAQKPRETTARPPAAGAPAQRPASQQPQQQKIAVLNKDGTRSVRYVDTRTPVSVDLSKYDERIEDMVPERAARIQGASKQKLKKSPHAQRAPYGTQKKRESEAERLLRLQLEKARKQQLSITLPDQISVGELATRLKVTNAQVVKKLMSYGVMASASEIIDFDTAAIITEEFGAKYTREVVVTIEDRLIDDSEDKTEDLKPRSPVVVVMGHVDHGKTSLLDAIRHANVVEGEAGGITQHIGAYRVEVKGREITFLDTPGHAAFTSMRARGAQVTDIAILVVAADDGIMPQTVEAINHAKAAGVSIVVAINKIDKETADPERVKQALTEYELVPEEWGGDVICVPVSALKRTNIDTLLEMVLLVADMKDLKANPDRAARGTVIEAKLDRGRGPVATVLVQSGTLRTGDIIIAGMTVGRVRLMQNDKGEQIDAAGPSVPVEIIGLSEVPEAGDMFHAVSDERMARELVEQRKFKAKQEQYKATQKVSLDDLFERIKEGQMKELPIIVKGDVQGSVEAVRTSLEKLSNDEVRVKVIHGGVGAISESDIMLATASNAIVVGFNVRPDPGARESAELNNVDIRLYRVIYECIEEVEAAMKGLLAPKYKEVIHGHAQVRQTFKVPGVGTVAGCYVTDGRIVRNSQVRLLRDNVVVFEGKISSLRRFKDDVREVAENFECGIGLERFNDIKENDVIESFDMEEIKP